MRWTVRIALALPATVACLSTYPISRAESTVPDHPMLGEPAPAFRLADVRGDTLSLADLRGRYVVIHFGTSW